MHVNRLCIADKNIYNTVSGVQKQCSKKIKTIACVVDSEGRYLRIRWVTEE